MFENSEQEIIVRSSGLIRIKRVVDGHDGVLCIMEAMHDIPFEIKRVYYINQFENTTSIRGKHAHRELRQVIFCLNGSFILSLDDGSRKQDVMMWRDDTGVLLGVGLWHTMHSFSNGCVILVVASDYYNESDYIRNYDDFLVFAKDHS